MDLQQRIAELEAEVQRLKSERVVGVGTIVGVQFDSAPRWHDRPTGPGLWVFPGGDKYYDVLAYVTEYGVDKPWYCGPCFGPIPPRSTQEDVQ